MNHQEYKALCQSKDFNELASFLTSDIKDVSLKITVTAIFDVYHPQDTPHGRGLDVWTKELSGQPVSPMQNLYSGDVDLIDFVKAYQIAENTLEDQALAQAIRQYIYKHKVVLSPILFNGGLDDETVQIINGLFPGLGVTRQEREQQIKLHYTAETQNQITFFRLSDAIRDSIAQLLHIKPYQFRFSMQKSEGSLMFKDTMSAEYCKKVVTLLELMGISAHYYCFPNQSGTHRGIQLFTSIQSMHQTFIDVNTMLSSQSVDLEKKAFFNDVSVKLDELEQLKTQTPESKSQYGVFQ